MPIPQELYLNMLCKIKLFQLRCDRLRKAKVKSQKSKVKS
ncbi:hypothetical protein NSP_11230 [Nodularia spumigena CCY9414]|nr:hypothetical protein NSP_11230 [Nodularia spumigena CCY9414]